MSADNTNTSNSITPPQQVDPSTNDSTNTNSDVASMLQAVRAAAMSNVWPKSPHSYQTEAITLLLSMSCTGHNPSSLFLIQGTGSGKSTVPKTVDVVTRGVAMVLKNMLALGADQTSKLCNVNQENDPFHAFQLDSTKIETEISSLKDFYWNFCGD